MQNNKTTAIPLKDDATVKNLLKRMPEEVQQSFTDEQLAHLKVALATRGWGKHAIDVRSTIKLFGHRYYYVFIAGRNRRELTRAEKHLSLLLKTALLSGFLFLSMILGLLVLYLIKSALGIDLLPNYSFGIWSWFKSLFA